MTRELPLRRSGDGDVPSAPPQGWRLNAVLELVENLTYTPKDSGYFARIIDQYTPRDADHITTL